MPEYRVIIYNADTGAANDFGYDGVLAEITHAKNIGYAHYLNDIGEAFFTVNQDDKRVQQLRAAEGTAHVVIARDGQAVWRGILAEHDANMTDVIFYAYGYEHVFYHLLTPWNFTMKNKTVKQVIDKLWSRAKSLDNSQLQFVSTGTTQAPVTTSGGSTAITLNEYKAHFKRILHAMKELVAVSTSDTNNVVYFEIDYGNSITSDYAVFNFWKDNGTDTSVELQYPGVINNFSDRYVPIYQRNDVKVVGSGARQQIYRVGEHTTTGTFGSNQFGRRMEPVNITWVRDEDELERVAKRRKALAIREDVNMFIRCHPNTLLPWRAPGSGYELGDRIRINIDRGITQIDKMLFVVGQQVIVANGVEYVQPMLVDRPGS